MHLYNFKQSETIGYCSWLRFQVICVLQLCYLFIHLIQYCATLRKTIRNNIAKDCLMKNGLDRSTNGKQLIQALC